MKYNSLTGLYGAESACFFSLLTEYKRIMTLSGVVAAIKCHRQSSEESIVKSKRDRIN
jgi:hypothetical protein